jgi:hypothetical protein
MAGFSTAPGTYVSNFTEVTTQYVGIANGSGFSIGDVLQQTQTFNPATNPPTVLSTVWSNLTQQTTGLAVPLASEIEPGGSGVTKGFTTVSADYLYIGAATADYSNNNVLQSVSTYDTSTSPTTLVSTVWNNISQGVYGIATPPLPARISGIKNPAYQVITSFYRVVNAFTDASVGDIVMAKYRVAYDNTILPADSIIYTNVTTQVEISVANMTDLVPIDAVNGVRQVTTNNYYAIATVAGEYTIGDVVQNELELDLSTTPPTVISSTWTNLTTGLSIAVPTQADILPGNAPASSAGFAVTANNYYAIATVAGEYTIGDVVQNEQKLDTSTTPPTVVSSTWINLTTGNAMLTPVQTDILPVDTPAGSGTITGAGTVTNQYLVITGTPEASPGDVVEQVISYNLGVTPPVPVGSKWNNVTTGLPISLSNTPDYNTLAPLGSADANTTRVASSVLFVANVDSPPDYAIGDIIEMVTILNSNENPPTTVSIHYDNLTQDIENITVDRAELTPLGGATPNPATINSRQLTVEVTPIQGPSQVYQNGVVITADGNNLQPIYVGGDNTVSTTTGYPLVPGQSMSYGVSNLNGIWFIGLNATDLIYISGN